MVGTCRAGRHVRVRPIIVAFECRRTLRIRGGEWGGAGRGGYLVFKGFFGRAVRGRCDECDAAQGAPGGGDGEVELPAPTAALPAAPPSRGDRLTCLLARTRGANLVAACASTYPLYHLPLKIGCQTH